MQKTGEHAARYIYTVAPWPCERDAKLRREWGESQGRFTTSVRRGENTACEQAGDRTILLPIVQIVCLQLEKATLAMKGFVK